MDVMIETIYCDLAEYGLPLITPGAPAYAVRLEEILSAPSPFGPGIDSTPDRAAVLENQTPMAVITLSYFWRYTSADGKTRTSRHLNLGSSRQMDVLTGRENVVRDLSSFILSGTRRLITEDRMYGDNRDVLAPQPTTGGGGWAGSRGAGRGTGAALIDVVKIALELDVAIFEDGLCVGPDETGLRESLTEQMQTQANTANEIAQVLRAGAPPGRIFEMLRPMARHRPPAPPPQSDIRSMVGRSQEGRISTPLLSMFARSAIHHLINADDAGLLAWFEAAATISPLRLHRPEQ
jgi:hypothetical protein